MQDDIAKADWIALDWGTTHLRGWAMTASGQVLAHKTSEQGMNRLTREDYEPALLDLTQGWFNRPITAIACGMVGSRQGWVEAPYVSTPCVALATDLVTAPTVTKGLTVHVIPGVKQDSPADVMRGEETQIAGFLALNPGWDGVICLPGTHTKWAQISAGEVISFQTCMTGELFSVIGTQTVLRHSVSADGWDDSAYAQGLADGFERPERLTSRLFSLRAEHLLHGQDTVTGRARLSGLLIGVELAATRAYWLGSQIAVIGAGKVASLYVTALAAQSAPAVQADGTAVTLAGLTAAWRRLQGVSS